MSLMRDCFARTVAAKGRVCGETESININGQPYDALIDTISATEMMLAGGTGKADGFQCQVDQDLFDKPPAKFSPAVARGVSLVILNVNDVNGLVYVITLGDPLIET